ncbi:actin cytoskeleton-regulatory complex protein PAN1 isoform X1 [Takifugu rubripes]|uniref:Actin cytoskeleton-regulatory complex protein PAN1-like n=1 Tax=Takifugu rubripes TaxID=31033 RepID=A0A3B5K1U9_TAKRU|nr:actin cytoskeleton-regulatory complex protein PAN1-like isoform X1 [Takifugu rubripes]
MTAKHRKSKNNHKHEENFFKNDVVEAEVRTGANSSSVHLVLFLVIVVGGAVGLWFCFQQHQTLSQLTDSVAGMQVKIMKLQAAHEEFRQSGTKQHLSESLETRLNALEESSSLAQKQLGVALATAEQLKSSDLPAQVLLLHTEMKNRLAEMQRATVSLEQLSQLQATLKGKSEEFEGVKSQVDGLAALSSEMSRKVEVLTGSLREAESKLEDGTGHVTALSSTLDAQGALVLSLKEQVEICQGQLEARTHGVATVREALQSEEFKWLQQASMEEQLGSLRQSLQDQISAAHGLTSGLQARLEDIQKQVTQLGDKTTAEPEDLDPVDPPEDLAPPDRPEDLAPPDVPEDLAPLDRPEDLAPPDVPEDLAPPDVPEDLAPPDVPEDLAPLDRPEDLAPPDVPEDLAPPDVPEDLAPLDRPEDLAPPDVPEDLAPPDVPEDLAPPDEPELALPAEEDAAAGTEEEQQASSAEVKEEAPAHDEAQQEVSQMGDVASAEETGDVDSIEMKEGERLAEEAPEEAGVEQELVLEQKRDEMLREEEPQEVAVEEETPAADEEGLGRDEGLTEESHNVMEMHEEVEEVQEQPPPEEYHEEEEEEELNWNDEGQDFPAEWEINGREEADEGQELEGQPLLWSGTVSD